MTETDLLRNVDRVADLANGSRLRRGLHRLLVYRWNQRPLPRRCRACWGDRFLDVGAHYGYFSLLAARRVGNGGRVETLEASPTTFATLAANVRPAGAETWNRAASDNIVFRRPKTGTAR